MEGRQNQGQILPAWVFKWPWGGLHSLFQLFLFAKVGPTSQN